MHNPRRLYSRNDLRLLIYIKISPKKGVCYLKANSLVLNGFSGADWAKCLFSRKSVSGYLVYFGDYLVSCRSKKKHTLFPDHQLNLEKN